MANLYIFLNNFIPIKIKIKFNNLKYFHNDNIAQDFNFYLPKSYTL